MTTSVSNKKIRTEPFNIVQDSKNLFQRLPSDIIYAISSYLNIMDARCMTNACRNFKLIPLHYLRNAHNQLQSIFDFCSFSLRSKKGLDILSQPWRLGVENALSKLKKIEFVESERGEILPENQIVRILSLTKSLETLSLRYCSEKVLKLASSFNLTELNISIDYDLDFSLLNKSLKKLSITSNQENLSIIDFNNKAQPLPNLETLEITQTATNLILDGNFSNFVTSLASLKKLELWGSLLYFDVKYLKNLKELILHDNKAQIVMMGVLGYPKSLEILTIHETEFDIMELKELKEFRKKILSLENLKKVNIIFNGDNVSSLEVLCNSEITALDKVYIKIYHNRTFLKKYDFCIKHLSLDYDLYDAVELGYLNLKFINLEEVKALCSIQDSKIGRKIIIGGEQVSYNDYRFIFGFDLFSEKITSIVEDEDFVWTKSMLAQLRRKPLMKCTSLTGRFVYEDETCISTTELLSLFPNLTSEKINRLWVQRYAIVKPIEQDYDHTFI